VQLDHVGDDFTQLVSAGRGRNRRAAVSAHIGRDAAPADLGEMIDLPAPDDPKTWPTMNEDHQRSTDGPHLDPRGPMPFRLKTVLAEAGVTRRSIFPFSNGRAAR
jgi:hypothetical protein